MSAAVDSAILLDILGRNPAFVEASKRSLDEALLTGPVFISEPVCAEVAPEFPDAREFLGFLDDLGIRLRPSGSQTLYLAGTKWRDYTRTRTTALQCSQCGNAQDVICTRCGSPIRSRQRVLADFLIAAHALEHADHLLTRDTRGFYTTYFPELPLA